MYNSSASICALISLFFRFSSVFSASEIALNKSKYSVDKFSMPLYGGVGAGAEAGGGIYLAGGRKCAAAGNCG